MKFAYQKEREQRENQFSDMKERKKEFKEKYIASNDLLKDVDRDNQVLSEKVQSTLLQIEKQDAAILEKDELLKQLENSLKEKEKEF